LNPVQYLFQAFNSL